MKNIFNTIMHAFSGSFKYLKSHRFVSAILILAILAGMYYEYRQYQASNTPSTYILGTVHTRTITSVLSESGQISATNQVVINPKAGGVITHVYVSQGDSVRAGQTIATIDSSSQYASYKNAQTDLAAAKINLAKLQEPTDALSLTQDQNAIASAQASLITTQSNLTTAYQTAYNDINATFLDLPAMITSYQDITIGTGASNGSQWNIDYYRNATQNWDSNAFSYRDNSFAAFNTTQSAYNAALPGYQALGANSATSTIEKTLNDTYTLAQTVTTSLNTTNSYIQFYENTLKTNNQKPSNVADTALTNLNTYITKMNAHLAALLSDINTIKNNKQQMMSNTNTITAAQLQLAKLQTGTDPLDIQSQQLSIEAKQNALDAAETTLGNYTIRSPISGVLAVLNVHVGDTVGNSTSAATLITNNQIAALSLNEVDASKISVGQHATLTFSALPDLTLSGTVSQISDLGSVSQGVVSYTVNVALDTQDPRIKSGMTVSASIETATHKNVLTIPTSAIKTVGGKKTVQQFATPFPMNTGNSASSTNMRPTTVTTLLIPKSVSVTIGINDATTTEILSGLNEGDQIIIKTATTGTAATKSAAATATSRNLRGGPPGL